MTTKLKKQSIPEVTYGTPLRRIGKEPMVLDEEDCEEEGFMNKGDADGLGATFGNMQRRREPILLEDEEIIFPKCSNNFPQRRLEFPDVEEVHNEKRRKSMKKLSRNTSLLMLKWLDVVEGRVI